MNFRLPLIATMTALALSSAGAVSAATTIFSGQDDGAPVAGPFTQSAAAQASFFAAAAAFGSLSTETFEGIADGYATSLPIVGGTLTTVSPNFGTGFSGVNSTTFGSTYGFNTTAGGSKWFGFPSFVTSSATFTFDAPTNSFGFYSTGVQSEFTAQLVVQLLDGSQATFDVPVNVNGGANYFGLIDTVGFSSVSIINIPQPGTADAFGIDDISFNTGAAGDVPEPATWAMMIGGFGMIGFASRRRRASVSVTA